MAIKSHGRLSISASVRPRELMEDRPTLAHAWTARVLTLYPEMFPGTLGQSLLGKALNDGLWQLRTHDIRDHGRGKHRQVDDTPSGGGAGMVLRADVLHDALSALPSRPDMPTIYLSPRGRRFDHGMAKALAAGPGVTVLCGRFEGVDQRVLDAHDIFEVSLGDFVLTGGEIAAQALIDATVRLIPRVLGNAESTEEESFSNGLLEHPQYTRPTDWAGHKIPEILLSGHHGAIAAWRREQSEALTKERRPDLWRAYASRDPKEGQEQSDAHTIAAKGEKKD
ncbi:tRNA (guanosine(37)-N1)-methyltransferase TrmD [Algicella marina]|uniref:tRNA (guanine-N(1)-)-methyltransferase n=1 Tax=Algicella marina TaxID=2683284 RepID=A0A6P1T270_9RHOB|nr:tRNA (guanosine(37)-N1)-methyltransferase TrmD [Algicella marina]QHQ35753.1 tRNA (guanosine(37)-N1)-methyltransferase TrmD [Algicella marina]